MPGDQQSRAAPRQRPVSCGFCRTRKLRCSREAPCSNCVSRDLHCELVDIVRISPGSPGHAEPEIIERLNRLEELLLAQNTEQKEGATIAATLKRRRTDSPAPHAEPVRPSALSPQIQGLADDVARLESFYTGTCFVREKPSRPIAFKICPIANIAKAQPYIYDRERLPQGINEPKRCIWLPQYTEAEELLGRFLHEANHFPRVFHVPSIHSILEESYNSLETGQRNCMKLGYMVLLLSIFACATHSWTQADCERGLFHTADEANDQALLWVRSTEDTFDIAYRSSDISLEGLQGILIASFLVANIEGFSRRCRTLYSMAPVLARDLGLHRIDHPSNTEKANTAKAEIGRRVWWHICASDWAIAARFIDFSGGVYTCHPRQMITKKPLNLDDEHIFDGMSRDERPMSHPTTMSFPLQRIRLADISRTMVDRIPLSMAHLEGSRYDEVMDIDTQLQLYANDIPTFFSMSQAELIDTYKLDPKTAWDLFYQGYMVHFLLHSQRCKLHLPYFIPGFYDTQHSWSRDICIKSARLIIQAQLRIGDSGPYTGTRFKFKGLLLGHYMASIVLLIDLCINRSSVHHDKQREEVAEAFQILDEAKQESKTAAKFVDSLMDILKKHKVPAPSRSPTRPLRPVEQAIQSQNYSVGEVDHGLPAPDNFRTLPDIPRFGVSSGIFGVNGSLDSNVAGSESFQGFNLPLYFNEFAQSLEQGVDPGEFDWNTILSGLETSFV